MRRIISAAVIATAVALTASCTSGTSKEAAPPAPPSTAAATTPPAGQASTTKPTPTTPPAPPAPPKAAGNPPESLWADDAKANRPDLSTYRTKWDYLQQECEQQGPDLAAIVIKVRERQQAASLWEAMNYMSALLSGPQSDCSTFLG